MTAKLRIDLFYGGGSGHRETLVLTTTGHKLLSSDHMYIILHAYLYHKPTSCLVNTLSLTLLDI